MTSAMAPPVACVPGAIPADERSAHRALARDLFDRVALERRPFGNGYEIRFPAATLERIARFMANERLCCPFMSFELHLPAAEGFAWLRMTGPAGTREVLDAELDLIAVCGCSAGGKCR